MVGRLTTVGNVSRGIVVMDRMLCVSLIISTGYDLAGLSSCLEPKVHSYRLPLASLTRRMDGNMHSKCNAW